MPAERSLRPPDVLKGRRSSPAANGAARAADGPLVSDEQWNADREYVRDHLRPRRLGDRELELIDLGQGEPILYVPILAHVEVIYARQLRDFGRDHRVLLYRRPESTDHPVGIDQRVQETRALLDDLGVASAHVVGRGEGAIVASAFALAHPERCRSLVMVNLGMRHKVPPVPLTTALNRALLHLPIEGRVLTDEQWRHKVVAFLSGADQRLTRAQLAAVYEEIPDFLKVCKYSVTPLVLHHDLRGRAQRLQTPTLLITSDEDPRATEQDLIELGAALPDCRGVHVLPHGGRFVNYVQGAETNRLIRAFYADLEPPRGRVGAGVTASREV